MIHLNYNLRATLFISFILKHSGQQELFCHCLLYPFLGGKNALVRLHLVFPQVKAASISQNCGLLKVHHLFQFSS